MQQREKCFTSNKGRTNFCGTAFGRQTFGLPSLYTTWITFIWLTDNWPTDICPVQNLGDSYGLVIKSIVNWLSMSLCYCLCWPNNCQQNVIRPKKWHFLGYWRDRITHSLHLQLNGLVLRRLHNKKFWNNWNLT